MTWRGLLVLLACAPAVAQLPRSQAPLRSESLNAVLTGRLDAVVADPQGRPIPGLKAADFQLEIDGAAQPVKDCEFQTGERLRLAVIVDDLSLSIGRLNAARRALRQFVANELRDGDELAILRAGAGTGALDHFTSDRTAMTAAIDRARFNPESERPTPEVFGAGALTVARAVLEGMREMPGRKALLVISEDIRRGATASVTRWQERLGNAAHSAGASIYAVDMNPPATPAIDRGLAGAAKETGGGVVEGDAARALTRIAQDQAGYYLLTFTASGFKMNYITRAPISRVALRTTRPDTVVRARTAALGAEPDPDLDREFERSINAELSTDGVRARVTPVLTFSAAPRVEVGVHVDGRDVTVVKGVDGVYRGTIETITVLLDAQGNSVKEGARTIEAQLGEASFRKLLESGFDYTIDFPVAAEGAYQVRAVVRDGASGRIGSTRQFIHCSGWKDGKLVMSSIVLRGETQKNPDGVEASADPGETSFVRSFRTSRKIAYVYHLANVAADAEQRSQVETLSEIWRDGVKIYTTQPILVPFPPSRTPGARTVSGSIGVSEGMAPGSYILRVTVTDKIAIRSVSQWVDFEVRP